MNAVANFDKSLPDPSDTSGLSPAAEPIFLERLRERRREMNTIFTWLLPAQWAFALLLALVISPLAWEGLSSKVHPHIWAALAGGALLASAPLIFIRLKPDAAITPHVVAVAQMLFSALFIHLTGGRIETHFHVFGSLAILAFYLDRSVLLMAGAVVVADHLLRGAFVPESVFGVSSATWWRSLEHGGWVVFEMVFLLHFTQRTVTSSLRAASEVAADQQALKDGEERLRLVIDTAYDAYVAMDPQGNIVGWNEQAERTFGWTREEVLGTSLSERIIPEPFREAHERGLKRFQQTGVGPVLGRRMELTAIHRDGREFPIEITISFVKCGETYLFNAFLRDISERRDAASRHEEMNRQLVEASRQAGKAEVAVGVLHNVGNVLNSVNVSAAMISDTVRGSKVKTLGSVIDLMRAQNGNLGEFITNDPKGRLVPELLGKLSDALRAEHTILSTETESLSAHVGHIRETVSLQQSHATVSGVSEKLEAHLLLEDALKLEGSGMVRHCVEIVREVDDVPEVIVDRHKALQILVNLLRNGKQALGDNDGEKGKRLTLGITQKEGGPVQISVRDNGMGITPENLSRIFGHGFTTKGNGRGFGLHISALAAREMGGTLTVQSDGPGTGSVFTLELPMARPEPEGALTATFATRPANRPPAARPSGITPPVNRASGITPPVTKSIVSGTPILPVPAPNPEAAGCPIHASTSP